MSVQLQNNLEPMVVDANNEENENQEEEAVLVENSSLDLDALSSSYSGLGRLYRLMFVADRCPSLKEEALRLALIHVETTCNVVLYQKIHQKLNEARGAATASGGAQAAGGNNLPDVAAGGAGRNVGGDSLATAPNVQWIEAKTKKSTVKLERLDTELKNSKVNSIKESVRRGHDDLGDHYLDCGELSNALKCYSRSRDYCTSHIHILEMCLNVIKVSIYLQNWSHVLSYVSKAHNTTDSIDTKGSNKDQANLILTKLNCAAGLAELATRKYKPAAKNFLKAQIDFCDYSEILSPYNVAVYGGLCALATFNRQELHKNVIMSSSFKQFLELEPQLRDIIFKFYESKYAQCLKLLDDMKDTLLLDMYLSPHVNMLYSRIRSRGLVQYFSPYKTASLDRMARAFNTTIPKLENELSNLILDGQMQARIDSHNKIIYAACVEERSVTFQKTLKMGQQHVDRLHLLVLKTALLRHQMHVKPTPRGDASHNSGLGDHLQMPAGAGGGGDNQST